MIDIEEAKRILAAFEREGVEYVMVGSMAMAAQGLVRATRDVDFFVASTTGNVANLRRALKSLYDNDPNVEEIRAEDLSGAYPAIEYIPPHGAYSLDILSRLGEAFRYETMESEELILDGIRVRVATPAVLYRMKKDTVRPQDRVDAQNLRRAELAPCLQPRGQVMGVRKFRSVEDMPGPAPLPRLDPENLRIAFGLSSLASGLRPVRRTPGVRKFGSWNEALAAKEESETASRRP